MEENQSNSLRRSYNNHRVHHDQQLRQHNDARHAYDSNSRERKDKNLEQTMMTHTQTTIDVSSPKRNKVTLH